MDKLTKLRYAALAALFLLLTAAAGPARGGEKSGLIEGLDIHHHPVTTESETAQRYFDQGLLLAFGFNHAEAERSFRQAAALDPEMAMAWWGVAFVLGPNINANMPDSAARPAYEAARKAVELSGNATKRERAYIEAVAKRYAPGPAADRSGLDRAFAKAMGGVAEKYPDDLDAATLHAESLMDLHPWDYWTIDGGAQPWTPEILEVLEGVLERDPDHIGANHLYIHAVEASPNPEKGLPSAESLRRTAPNIGHLLHMPAHIYIRTGHYKEAVEVNRHAISGDKSYFESHSPDKGLYTMAYHPHNYHFLMSAATLSGRSRIAIKAARDLAGQIDREMMRKPGLGTLQHFYTMPWYTLARFGRWDEVLAEPAPAPDLLYPTGVWRYARGLALARTGRLDEARGELERLKGLAAEKSLRDVRIFDLNSTASLLAIAVEVLEGEIYAEEGGLEKSRGHLEKGVALEDDLIYDEPPSWYYSVRQSLGAVLMDMGKAEEAERVYREDLKRYPENGWGLYGLHASLKAQGRDREAKEVWERFEKAWELADVELSSSRF